MIIKKTINDGGITVAPEGRLDALNAGEFGAVLNESINDELKALTIDLAGVDYISSMGLRTLVSAYHRMNGKAVILINVNSSVMEVLNLTGLSQMFGINE